MAIHDVLFPTDISFGSRGGPGFSTSIIQLDSGAEERVARWNAARRRYNAAYGVKTQDQLGTLIDFYIARQGPAYGFRYRDPLDWSTAANHRDAPSDTDVDIGVGDASEDTFQLTAKYVSGVITRTRTITKPITGSVVVALDDVSQGSGWTVNTTTGKITFTSPPGAGVVVSAGCQFDVPCRFGQELDEVLSISLDAFDTGGLEDIPIVEIRDEDEIQDEFFFGGAKDHGVNTGTTTITLSDGRVHRFAPAVTGTKCRLPGVASTPLGGPHFFIVNDGSEAIEVEDAVGTGVVTVATSGRTTIVLGLVGATRTWFAL